MKIGRFARYYRWCEYAAFERALERARFAHLDRLTAARRVLILGEGDGRALTQLLAIAPEARIDVIEVSAEMIALARRRCGNSGRVDFRQENALTATWPEGEYDAVLTFFFLDCFTAEQARGLTSRLARALRPGGIWLVSDFAVPARGWRKWHARIWLWIMYRFFGILTGLRTRALPPIEKLLAEAGMERIEVRERRWGSVRAEVWQKCNEKKSLAADEHISLRKIR